MRPGESISLKKGNCRPPVAACSSAFRRSAAPGRLKAELQTRCPHSEQLKPFGACGPKVTLAFEPPSLAVVIVSRFSSLRKSRPSHQWCGFLARIGAWFRRFCDVGLGEDGLGLSIPFGRLFYLVRPAAGP